MSDEEVRSLQYEEIARVLVPQIATLVQDAGFIVPVEVLVTDADDHMVCCLEMNAIGVFRSLHDRERLLSGRFPIKVTVTDKNGKTWTASLTVEDLPALLD